MVGDGIESPSSDEAAGKGQDGCDKYKKDYLGFHDGAS
jgi:hypothetical protein